MFLFGMKLMSDGLEQVAGARMRSILEFFTQNRFIGMIVGLVFTGIIQSSNATTVMVVSFVNSGLMQLSQAAGPILGANIGTTVTGQLIAFNLAEIAPLFVIICAVMYMFFENQNVKKIGIVLLGFPADCGTAAVYAKSNGGDHAGICGNGGAAERFCFGGDHHPDGCTGAAGL